VWIWCKSIQQFLGYFIHKEENHRPVRPCLGLAAHKSSDPRFHFQHAGFTGFYIFTDTSVMNFLFSVGCYWLGDRKGIRPGKSYVVYPQTLSFETGRGRQSSYNAASPGNNVYICTCDCHGCRVFPEVSNLYDITVLLSGWIFALKKNISSKKIQDPAHRRSVLEMHQ